MLPNYTITGKLINTYTFTINPRHSLNHLLRQLVSFVKFK